MMTSMLISASCIMAWAVALEKNPMKMCILLLTGATLGAVTAATATSMSCPPLILMMIFMGGIIMMFMILCSILPNQSGDTKKKNMKAPLMMFSLLMVLSSMPMQMSEKQSMMKTFMEMSQNVVMMTIIMTAYFVVFNKIMQKEKSSMRTVEC